MNDSEGKKWTLKQISKRHRVLKNGRIKGYTLRELQKFGGEERKRIARRHGLPSRTAYGRQLHGISDIPEMPPGEGRIKAYVEELENDGEIRYHDTLEKKRKVAKKKKKKNDYGGGRGNKRILVPTDLSEKIKHFGDTNAIKILGLKRSLGEFRDIDNDKIGVVELAKYVTEKNTSFRLPVEYALKKPSRSEMIFEYVHREIAGICDEVEEKICKDRRLRPALKALERLASSDEFLRKGTLRFEPERDDLAISRSVIVVKDLEKPQNSAKKHKDNFRKRTKMT